MQYEATGTNHYHLKWRIHMHYHHCRIRFLSACFFMFMLVMVLPGLAQCAVISIASIEELQKIGNDPAYPLSGSYKLAGNIDASSTRTWNAGAGFVPISSNANNNSTTPFTGSFNGQGYTIKGLYVNRPLTKYIGLFGNIETGAVVSNITMINSEIQGYYFVGCLAGYNRGGSISGCSTSGTVISVAYAGGLAGANGGTITGCYSSAAVSATLSTGDNNIGGLVGNNAAGSISNCSTSGTVNGSYNNVGGLVGLNGLNPATIINCSSSAAVSGGSNVGGLVGSHMAGFDNTTKTGFIKTCYSSGSVSGTGSSVGGLVGANDSSITTVYIIDCYSSAAVHGSTASNYVGGLVGNNSSSITGCYSSGAVTGKFSAGGLVGRNSGTTSNCFWDKETSGWLTSAAGTGKTTAELIQMATYTSWDFSTTGPWFMLKNGQTRPLLRMEYATTIRNSHQLQLMVMNPAVSYTLANDIDCTDSFSHKADIWSTDKNNASPGQGFVPIGVNITPFSGSFDGKSHVIRGLYINRPTTDYIGLFGYVSGTGAAIATVGIEGSALQGKNYVGALVGYNDGNIADCYNSSSVNGISYVGGLTGKNNRSITDCYSSGPVSGTDSVGGLAGDDSGIVAACFWDNETSGQATSAGGTGKTTAEMKTKSTFSNAGWNFTNVWSIFNTRTYPFFRSANDTPSAAPDRYSAQKNTPLTIAAPGVLDNDTDANGDGLTAILETSPANGNLTLHADGSFTYSPDSGFTGTDSFTYRANDGASSSSPATVTITVTKPIIQSTTTTSIVCPAPQLISPSGLSTAQRPVFSWQKADGVAWYGVSVYYGAKNYYAANQWFEAAIVCTGDTCSAQLDRVLYPGPYWWWLSTWSDGACGFQVQPGGQYKSFTVVPCTSPVLTSPDGDILARGAKPAFKFSDSGAQWYNIMAWTGPGGGWLGLDIWAEASLVCSAGTCTVPSPKAFGLGSTWWWLNTWSQDCGYQMQPGGGVKGFTVQ